MKINFRSGRRRKKQPEGSFGSPWSSSSYFAEYGDEQDLIPTHVSQEHGFRRIDPVPALPAKNLSGYTDEQGDDFDDSP